MEDSWFHISGQGGKKKSGLVCEFYTLKESKVALGYQRVISPQWRKREDKTELPEKHTRFLKSFTEEAVYCLTQVISDLCLNSMTNSLKMQDAVMFYKEKTLDTIRRGITEHYQYSKDLCEMWFYMIEKDASRLERIGILGRCQRWYFRVVSLTFPAINSFLSIGIHGWIADRGNPWKATLSLINWPARAHYCQLCHDASGHLSNNTSRCPSRDSCYIIFVTMWLGTSDGKSEPVPLFAGDLIMLHYRGMKSYRCHKMWNGHWATGNKSVLVKKYQN